MDKTVLVAECIRTLRHYQSLLSQAETFDIPLHLAIQNAIDCLAEHDLTALAGPGSVDQDLEATEIKAAG